MTSSATEIALQNRAKIKAKFQRTIEQNPAFVHDAINALAGRFLIALNEKIPRDSGAYARSWKKFDTNDHTVTVMIDPSATFGDTNNQMPMAILGYWLEISGTSRHFIAPVNAPALSWIGKDGVRRYSKGHFVSKINAKPHIIISKRETNREWKFIVRACAMKHFEYMRGAKKESLSTPIEQLISVGKSGILPNQNGK